MPLDTTIADLMTAAEHDLMWLKKSLHAAIKLEFATIPPYLCAYWSIKGGPVAQSVHVVFREEMLHMGLACNLLVALGGSPSLNAPDAVQSYPGKLPGGVHPGLDVSLQRLSLEQLNVFLTIEYPEGG